jgi:hypothetical protein
MKNRARPMPLLPGNDICCHELSYLSFRVEQADAFAVPIPSEETVGL